MLIIFLFFGTLVLGCGSATTATYSSEELNDLCESHTFQSVKSILIFVDQLQKEQLSNKCESNEKEINEMHEKVRQMQIEIAEGKLKDDLILGKDSQIKVQDNYIKELQNTISLLKQNVELIAENKVVQLTHELNSCQLGLNAYTDQLKIQNSTIIENSITISQLKEDCKTLKESQGKQNQSQVDLPRQNDIIQEKEQEIFKLKEQAKEHQRTQHGCGDSNGIYNITLPNNITFSGLCNSKIAGPGWIVIQQRLYGNEDFYRDWEAYKTGFGYFSSDFFLGLEKIHLLTKNNPHELYIHMERYNGAITYARYNNFQIAGEDDKYRLLSLGTYTGTADSDRMRNHEKMKFSTYDSDNDASSQNCAIIRHGGWWYKDCTNCNLNGEFHNKEVDEIETNWWKPQYSLKTIKMMIHPRCT